MTAKASEVRISLSPEATPEQMRAYIKKLEAQAQSHPKAIPKVALTSSALLERLEGCKEAPAGTLTAKGRKAKVVAWDGRPMQGWNGTVFHAGGVLATEPEDRPHSKVEAIAYAKRTGVRK